MTDANDWQKLTAEYARYSRSAGGLAATLGGALCLVSWLVGGLLPPTLAVRALLVALPVVWLVAREVAKRHYQRYGRVQERVPEGERRWHWVLIGVTGLVALVELVPALNRHAPLGPEAWTWQVAAYLLLMASLPFVVWRWLHPSLDFVVGVFLICQAALAAGGVTYSLVGVALVFVPVGLAMIAAGVRQHLRFRELDARLAAARGAR